MRRFVLLLVALFGAITLRAEHKEGSYVWHNPQNQTSCVVHGQGWSDQLRGKYWRLPERAEQSVRKSVWRLSKHSAGLHLRFKSDAEQIKVRYVPTFGEMSHFANTGVAGMDLYLRNSKGEWRYCEGRRSAIKSNDTVTFTFNIRTPELWRDSKSEFYLYLPLYAQTLWCEVGVAQGCDFEFVAKEDRKPVIAFGTSILQGGCASRPGMAWSNIVSRTLDVPILNFGFSGNGRFEPEVVSLIGELDAAMYIFACLPNMGKMSEEQIVSNIREGVKHLRQQRNVPILFCEQYAGVAEAMNQNAQRNNRLLREVYGQLRKSGVRDIYYLTAEQLALPMEATVDGTHPTDYGMVLIADVISKKLRKILK